MSDTVDKDKWDVFLVHGNNETDRRMAIHIFTFLQENNLSCVASGLGGEGGKSLEVNQNMIEHSVNTLILLTLEGREKGWLKVEMIHALEKALKYKRTCVRLLVEGDWKEELKNRGFLGTVPCLSMESNWERSLLHEIQKGPEILDNPFPAGNLALGQVYSVVVGFYTTVLPLLNQTLREHEIAKQNLSKTSTKFFILIPSDCRVWKLLTQCGDPRIRLAVKDIPVVDSEYVGKRRPYYVNLYSISEGQTEYYFVGEIPYVLNTISVLHRYGSRIVEVDLSFEVQRFFMTLERVLTHRMHKECSDTFRVIRFKEGTLVNTVLDEIKSGISATQVPNTECEMSFQLTEYEWDAGIVFDEDIIDDRNIAVEISETLSSQGLKVTFGVTGEPKLEFLDKTRWKIFILSKECRLWLACIDALTDSIDKDKIGVIPVLNGLTVKDIPDFMTWVWCTSTKEGYIDNLLSIMKGQELHMHDCLPRGNIFTGLVWGYIINYLPIPLLGKAIGSDIQPTGLDLSSRIKKTLKDNNIMCGCVRKLYIHVPKTCKDRKLDDVSGVSKIGELDPVRLEERLYRLAMYSITSPDLSGTQICFLAEQATPTRHLYDICERYRDVGISQKELHNQSEEFCKSCIVNIGNEFFIQDVGDLNSLCQFIFYDDETQKPAEALEILKNSLKDAIRADLKKNVEVVYQ